MSFASNTTLSLSILSIIQKYGKVPRALLYDRLSASKDDIDTRLNQLKESGAVTFEGDVVTTRSDS